MPQVRHEQDKNSAAAEGTQRVGKRMAGNFAVSSLAAEAKSQQPFEENGVLGKPPYNSQV